MGLLQQMFLQANAMLMLKALETDLPPYLAQQLCAYAPTRALCSSASKLLQVPCTNLQFACLTWQIVQLLTSHATNFLDRNHPCSLSVSRSVTELVNCLFTCELLILSQCEHMICCAVCIISSSVTLEAMFVWRLFADR